MVHRTILKVFRLCALLTLLGSCASLIGIEDAECDPEIPDCDTDGPSALCRDYCATVMKNCTGENAIYEGIATCYAVCKVLPPGNPGDDSGNTVACRLRQAEEAGPEGVNEPATHCSGASPGGEGRDGTILCSDNCDGYCAIMQEVCTDFESLEQCKESCGTAEDLGGYDTSHTMGDFVQCRLWHASAAAELANPHCLHAAGKSYCTQ